MIHLPGLFWPHVCQCAMYRWPHRSGLGRCHASYRKNPTMQWGSAEAQQPFGGPSRLTTVGPCPRCNGPRNDAGYCGLCDW